MFSRGFNTRFIRSKTGEVRVADEPFLCGSGMEDRPAVAVDGFCIGNGGPGPLTTAIRGTYMAVVGGETDLYPEWADPGRRLTS